MSELAAAAERRRKHQEARVSMESPYYDSQLKEPWPYSRQLDKDAAELADAYLAEHPADDVTPLNTADTFDWLDKLKPATGDLSMLCVRMYADGLHLVVNDYVCPSVATKGVVRSLLTRVLGIPLTGDVR